MNITFKSIRNFLFLLIIATIAMVIATLNESDSTIRTANILRGVFGMLIFYYAFKEGYDRKKKKSVPHKP